MPAYNAAKYLREAIDSILAQTFTDFEFIIINDGSTDDTRRIIMSYDDPRIIYLENEQNSGICVTLNRGLDIARGRYIARMDADDISLPERFAIQLEFLKKHPKIGIVGTDLEVFGEGIISYIFNQVYDSNGCAAGLLFNSCFAHPTVMWRKEISKEHNLKYEDDYRGLEDYRLWWRFASVTRLANIPKPLLRYRKHKAQETQNVSERQLKKSVEFITERYYAFGAEFNGEDINILSNYSLGRFDLFGSEELKKFSVILKKVLEAASLPISTSRQSLKITISKALVYTIINSPSLRKRKRSLISEAFVNGLIPPIWYLKYLKATFT